MGATAVSDADLEQLTPSNVELLELAERYPAPQEWYDEDSDYGQ